VAITENPSGGVVAMVWLPFGLVGPLPSDTTAPQNGHATSNGHTNAALAGAQQLDQQAIHQGQLALDPQQAQAAALSTMSGEPGIQVQADATSAQIHVQVTRRFPTILLRLVGLADLTVSAQANAAPRAP